MNVQHLHGRKFCGGHNTLVLGMHSLQNKRAIPIKMMILIKYLQGKRKDLFHEYELKKSQRPIIMWINVFSRRGRSRPVENTNVTITDWSTNRGTRGKSILGDPLTPSLKLWWVDGLEPICKLDGWERLNGFMLTQQCTTNIACIVETMYIFNHNYNLKTK